MKTLLFFFSIIVLYSCKNTSTTTKKNLSEKSLQAENICRFNVSFISIGSGTDKNARQLFLDFIKDYEVKNSKKLVVDVVPWGREGEVDYCFKLTELKVDDQNNFILNIKELLKQSKLVRYSEDSPIRKNK